MTEEIIQILSKISKSIEIDNLNVNLSFIPTDLKYFKPICSYALQKEINLPITLFLYVQTYTPFSISNFICYEDRNVLIRKIYHFYSAKSKNYVPKIIANLFRDEFENFSNLDEFRKHIYGIVYNYNQNKNTNNAINRNLSHNIDNEIFYSILLNLSKTSKSTLLSSIRLQKEDQIFILRYKTKILSNYFDNEIINNLISFLNVNNTLLSLSLSKAIYKIILKSQEKAKIIDFLLEMADDIFAKEFIFINIGQIFSYLILRGISIEADDVISKMINYNSKVVYNNEQVRETGLLLLWSCIRSGKKQNDANVLHDLILMALFDCSVNCRRAASSVLLEFLGHNKIEKTDKIVNLINFDTVKRLETNTIVIPQILMIFPDIQEKTYNLCKQNLFNYKVLEERHFFAKVLCLLETCFCKTSFEFKANFNYIFGVCNYLINSKTCPNCKLDLRIQEILHYDIKCMLSHKNFELFIILYAKGLNYIVQNFKLFDSKNIIFCLDKNYCAEEISCAIDNIECENLYDLVYKNFIRRQNDAYILANSKNKKYHDNIAKMYIKILVGCDTEKKATVVKALLAFVDFDQISYKNIETMLVLVDKYTKHNINFATGIDAYNTNEILLFYMLLGLEDYSVNIKGDAGFFVRHNAIRIITIKYPDIGYKYLIRYSVDKSPKLRADSIKTLIANFKDKVFVQEYIKFRNTLNLENNLSEDEKHFRSAFFAYNYLEAKLKEEFMIAILASYKNCDSYTVNILQKFLFTDFAKVKPIIIDFLYLKRRYYYLSLHFLNTLAEKETNLCDELLEILIRTGENIKTAKINQLISKLESIILKKDSNSE